MNLRSAIEAVRDWCNSKFFPNSEINISNPTNNQVLKYDSASEKWVNGSISIPSDIDDLGDVNLSSPTNGQVLKYNSTNDKWENADESGGGASALDDLSDVNISNPSGGQVLRYDDVNDQWYNSEIPSGGYSKTLVYDGGSNTSYAPTEQDVNFLRSISGYDQLLILLSSSGDGGLDNRSTTSAVIIDRANVQQGVYSGLYNTRLFRISATNTTFNYTSSAAGEQSIYEPKIYKIWGLVYGGSSGGASDIDDLNDVDITNLSNGQVLKYNSTTQKWENANESGGGGTKVCDLVYDCGDLDPTSDTGAVLNNINYFNKQISINEYDELLVIGMDRQHDGNYYSGVFNLRIHKDLYEDYEEEGHTYTLTNRFTTYGENSFTFGVPATDTISWFVTSSTSDGTSSHAPRVKRVYAIKY